MRRMFVIIIGSFIASSAFAAYANPEVVGIARGEWLRVLLGLLVMVLLIIGLAWLTKQFRRGSFSTRSGIDTITEHSLGLKEKISVIKVANRYLLLGITPHHINLLYDFGDSFPNDSLSQMQGKSFSDTLKAIIGNSMHEK